MEHEITIVEIISRYLSANKFDGLANENLECGCSLDDFIPCEGPSDSCAAGHKKMNVDGEMYIEVFKGE